MDYWIKVSDPSSVSPTVVQLSQVSSIQFEGYGNTGKATLRLATADRIHGEEGVNMFTIQGEAVKALKNHISNDGRMLGADQSL